MIKKYWFELCTVLFAFAGTVLILFDYSLNVPHSEAYELFAICHINQNVDLSLRGLINAFHICYDGASARPRFYSWYMWTFNLEFRTWLFQYVPFHPSVSLNWLLSYSLIPFFTFQLLCFWGIGRRLALLSSCLLLFTQGFLSNQVLYFHAAKPMAMLGIVVGLHLIARFSAHQKSPIALNAKQMLILSSTLFLFLFWDELFYGFFLMAPILYPTLLSQKNRWRCLACCAFLFVVFIIFVDVLAKIPHEFPFWEYAFKDNSQLLSLDIAKKRTDLLSIVSVHLDPFVDTTQSYAWREAPWSMAFFIFTSVGLLAPLLLRWTNWQFYARVLVSSLVFYLFVHLILTRRDNGLFYGTFYWGSSLSLVVVFLYATFWQIYPGPFRRTLILLCFAMMVTAGYRHTASAVRGHAFQMGSIDLRLLAKPLLFTTNDTDFPTLADARKIGAAPDLATARAMVESRSPYFFWLYYEYAIQKYGLKEWSKAINQE